ncbi:MAG: PrgI family protein [Peptococcaceae bacterium]|nr:PrgI family protein [Peptococcaceae bacterium]
MRDYPVPFSSREESPFIFGLSVREMLWISGGVIAGLILAAIVFVLSGSGLQDIIFCMPALLPTTGIGLYMAKRKVVEDDNIVTLDRHLFKKIKYRFSPHKYLNTRR